jgi:hypothetical protein
MEQVLGSGRPGHPLEVLVGLGAQCRFGGADACGGGVPVLIAQESLPSREP